tara:strand:+ start:3821 stop:4579 length:759 start_codon:yes stop_codon:yes gene_type:complete
MKKLVIHHNTGLGDHLICNGIVNFFSESKKIYLICNSKNYGSIKYLYSENENVKVLPIFRNNIFEKFLIRFVNILSKENYQNSERLISKIYSKIMNTEILYLGFDDIVYPEWDKSFYKIANINFDIRYKYFNLPSKLPKKVPKCPDNFILIQDISSQGKYELTIETDMKKIYLGKIKTKNFFENLVFVKNAKEVHCIDSSLVHLLEGMERNVNQQLFFHDVERYNQKSVPDARFNMRHNWIFVKYKKNSSFY